MLQAAEGYWVWGLGVALSTGLGFRVSGGLGIALSTGLL